MKSNSHWEEIKELLNLKAEQYNCPDFIENDPICVPHLFSRKEDIEIAGFFSATLAWGNRKTIIVNSKKLMEWMDNAPGDFIRNHRAADRKRFKHFKHRTFNGEDCSFFLKNLQRIYNHHGGLEKIFCDGLEKGNIKESLIQFREIFLGKEKIHRAKKHVSNPADNSATKRLCMYLRWMVRDDYKGCDFGLWKKISPAMLYLPLDVHTGTISRKLGLLKRKQNDWQAVEEVTGILRKMDSKDPVKYDFALFGLGVSGELDF